jgi:UDP-N-acetylmuramate: L-alanyl-gamma-D-glutamyl-meso-diaminopimelate ligase
VAASDSSALDIHCIAIGGTGMAPLACLLQEAGHRVRGSDQPLYPPMSTLLGAAGIQPLVGYDAAHLTPAPDLVVVGNAVPRSNAEAVEAERRGLPRVSMPEALARFFLAGRRPLVVAGTHGKTTTSALAAFVFTRCGGDPGYLVGGVPRDLPASFRRGHGARFIVEGDEYNAAYFDRGAKFLHYRPETLILTSVEHDHADLYATAESLHDAYRQLIAQLPPTGLLVACGDEPKVRELAAAAPCAVVTFGHGEANDVRPRVLEPTAAGMRVVLADRRADGDDGCEFRLPLWGPHNASNALGVWIAARRDQYTARDVAAALGSFHGVKRRQEEIGEGGGVLVVDDFAHHPTAVAKTLEGLRQRYPGRSLVALFEPRSLTAGRSFLFDAYAAAFAAADRVHFAPTFHAGRLRDDERLDLPALADMLSARGVPALVHASIDALVETALGEAAPGDVLITMSSGSFGGAPHRLAQAIAAR